MKTVTIMDKAMGGEIEFVFYDIDNELVRLFYPEIIAEEIRLEKIFNLFDRSSEVSRLNLKRSLTVSDELLYVIKKSIEFSKLTNGKYDITLGKNFLERKNNQPLSKINCSYRDIIITSNNVSLNHPDIILDLGSIAKGYIIDCLIEFIIDKGFKSFLIDARGDIRIHGEITEIIGVKDPRIENKTIDNIKLKNKSVATSGDYKQYFGSYEKSHILNSGKYISVSVISNDLMTADALATSIFVSDNNNFNDLLTNHKNSKIMTIDSSKKINKYNWD